MANQQYCLRWNNHQNNLLKVFSRLLGTEQLTDVVVAAEGCTIRAHKVVLSACSAYFEHLFSVFNEANQIVVLKDTSFADATAIVEFMYRGEINVSQGQLASLLRSAENLKVKGLAEVSGTPPTSSSSGNSSDFSAVPMMPPPMSRSAINANTLKRHNHGPDSSGGGCLSHICHNSHVLNIFFYLFLLEVKRKRGRPRTLDSPNEPPDPCFVPSRYHQVSSSSSSSKRDNSVPAPESTSPIENGYNMATPGGPLTAERLGELGIVKMNDYLSNGTRQQFWEEYFVKVILHVS